MKFTSLIYLLLAGVFLLSCKTPNRPGNYLFTTLDSQQTGLSFSNKLYPTPELNMLKYMYYYNGAGAGAGDFNNDGKIDLFFAGNQVQNRLFLNEGALHFKDVTLQAGIPHDSAWSTGVSVMDINNDGMLDIYVCRVSNFRNLKGKNQLLVCKQIKNGIPIFEEQAEKYGLAFAGFGTQAAFFDYDLDGDVDMFLLNHSVNHDGNFARRELFLNTYDSLTGDQMFRNENGHFVNITGQCGINSSKIGYGLGISISDINVDGWPDIYIGNDFHENDYLYINQKNGTFKEELNRHIMHTSQFSMGVDVADVNNDAYPDIIAMDMLPDDPQILKRSLGEDDYQTHLNKIGIGYNYQYSRNTLQLNRRNGMFSEIAFYSGISATDWSWACLLVDFDNDGLKDLFISNGIPKRLNDIDYVTYLVNDAVQQKIQNNNLDDNEMAAIYKFPEIKLPNRFFLNNGKAKFEDISQRVDKSPNTFSNGAVYADLDNDGDLDIVVNNVNDAVLIYQNNNAPTNKYADIKLKGNTQNINAIGARVYVFGKNEIKCFEKFAAKGFLSSMEIPLHIGVGNGTPDSAFLVWPDNTFQKLNWDTAKTHLEFIWQKGLPLFDYGIISSFYPHPSKIFTDIAAPAGLNFLHQDNIFNEYNREALLLKMLGNEGPALAIADVNGDGLEDVYVGNSKWKAGELFIQSTDGKFIKIKQPSFLQDSTYEDVDACFADVNNDHFIDLIVASGGNEFYVKEPWLQPRIYLNDGKGNMTKAGNPFPGIYITQSCVKPFDFNGDGFVDLFIGGRATPFAYGKIPTSYLLQNDGKGHFKDVTNQLAQGLSNTGFVTNAAWVDINNDKTTDLVITKEWGTIEAYLNIKNSFVKNDITVHKGWWNFILPVDIDLDGDMDFIAGNQGENSRLQPSENFPVKMYYNDFDENGTREQIVTYFQKGKEIPLSPKMDIERQLPYIKKKYLYASDFAKASLSDLFGADKLKNSTLYSAGYFSNAVLINDGKGNFETRALPWQAQLSCLRDAAVVYANKDSLPDILTGGNFYEQAMQLNRNDADMGTLLINKGRGNFEVETINGITIKNEIRHIKPIRVKNKPMLVIARNNDSLLLLQ